MNRQLIYLLLIICSVLFLTGCRSVQEIHDETDSFLNAAVTHWNFQGGVLIMYKGEPILMKGYGQSNIPFQQNNSPITKFFIGSLTKQFTATAIMRLAEENKLSLSDHISKYLDIFPNTVGDKITIEQLLTHSSGIPNFTDMPEIFLKRTEPIAPDNLLAIIASTPLEFEPGTNVKYSNSGYIVLGAIIEKLTGQSYEAYLHKLIFKPLKMNNSGYARKSMGLPNRAEGYTLAEGNQIVNAVDVEMSILHSAGALYTTLEDMVKWEQALQHGTILTEVSLRKMFTPHHAGNFGYGWALDTMYQQVVAYHGGFIDGFNCRVERWLNSGFTVVVFANDDEAPVFKICRSLAAIAFGFPYQMPIAKQAVNVTDDALKKYTGLFQYPDGRYRIIAYEDDTLHSYIYGLPREHLFVEANNRLYFEKENTKTLTISFDSNNRADRIIEENGFTTDTAYRVDDNNLPPILPQVDEQFDYNTLDNFSGEYRLKSMADDNSSFILTVYHNGNQLYAKVTASEPVELFPLSDKEFFHKTTDYRLIFIPDKQGIAQAVIMRMSGAEVRGVRIAEH